MFFTGCGQSSDQQALEKQKQKNEELQKQVDKQAKEEAQRKAKEEKARQAELEEKVDDLQQKVEEQEKEQNQTSGSSGTSSDDSSGGTIENSSTSPSQAAEGVVVVSSDFNTAAATAEEAEVINAAINYYQYAEIGDYYTTYDLLSYEDQGYYTVDQWVSSNTVLDSAAGEFVVTDAYPDDLGLGLPTYAVTVTVYAGDGSSFNRTTYFVNEGGGYWAHYLNEEEVNMFDDALY